MAGQLGRIRARTDSGVRTFYVDIRPYGRIYSIPDPGGAKSIPIRDRRTARRVLESIRAAVADGKTLEQATAPWLSTVSPQLRVGYRYDLWVIRMEDRVASGERSRGYVAELRRYGKPGGYLEPIRQVPVFSLSFGHLEDLDAALAARGLAPKTRAHVLATLRTFLRWLRRRGDIAIAPEVPTVSIPEHLPRLLEPQTQRAVIEAIAEDRRGIFLALAYHGLRPSEAARLEVADYDWRSGELRPWRTKSKRSRVIPCSDELRGWIERHVDRAGRLASAPLFRNPRGRKKGQPWSLDALEDTWEAACRALGVSVGLYEGTKHSSATAARRSGVALEVIQQALGHADVRSTARYARAAELSPVSVLQLVPDLSLAGKAARKDER